MGQQLRRVGQRWQAGVWVLLFTVALVLTLMLSPGRFSLAQESSPENKEELIELIEARAVSHAQIGDQLYLSEVYEEFKDNGFGLERTEIQTIYENKFQEERQQQGSDWWEELPFGWIVAVFVAIGSIFKSILEEQVTAFAETVWTWFYAKIAGIPIFLSWSLGKYQKTLQEKLTNLDTPFKIEPPLAMAEVYVPLKIKQVAEEDEPRAQPLSQGTELDIYTAMARHKRLMVTGPPGSGKSVLLKHIAFTYGESRLNLPEQRIPVRLELNSLRSADLDEAQFVSKLVAVLDANGFPNAERFVQQGLESGKLLLLLDGLDEVPSEIRDDVVVVINGVLEKYGDCPAIVTCRTAVYEHEFDVVLDRNLLEVVEFTDYQIRNFLQAWKSRMPAEKSVEQLMQTLQDRPKIKTLARNPLLLTIITYLYTETTFVLPHSRAEFYEKATNMLLELRDQERNIPNRYAAIAKRQVLRRLALVAQDALNPENPDRRSIPHQVVRQEVGQVLPDLNLSVVETDGILEEIIARSGLLLEIDGGERFQFAHLTLQEFFAAAALQNDQAGLVERFERDVAAWREVVKLWCGLVGNSTGLIEKLYESGWEGLLLAFECLAEAQEVERSLAGLIFFRMRQYLKKAAIDEEIANAFGSVAADISKPRGRDVLEFLQEQLETGLNIETRVAAANALARTNLPKAANILAERYPKARPEVVNALIKMGSIAVASTAEMAYQGNIDAVDDLYCINAPGAAEALVPLLWYKDSKLQVHAAWLLSNMLMRGGFEEEIQQSSDPTISSNNLEWIWYPFSTSQNSKVSMITGRIAELLLTQPEPPILDRGNYTVSLHADSRLLIPLCLFKEKPIEPLKINPEDLEKIKATIENGLEETRNRFKKYLQNPDNSLNEDFVTQNIFKNHSKSWVQRQLSVKNLESRWGILLKNLNPVLQLNLLYRLEVHDRQPEKRDWINLYKPTRFNFSRSWMYWVILAIAFITSVGAIAQMFFHMVQQSGHLFNSVIATTIVSNTLLCFSVYEGINDTLEPNTFHRLGFYGMLTFWQESVNLLKKRPLWEGVKLIYEVVNPFFLTIERTSSKALIFVRTPAKTAAKALVQALVVLVLCLVLVVLILLAEPWTLVLTLIISSLLGCGVAVWSKVYEHQQQEHPKPIPFWAKLLALFAFPFYCWFPITTIFSLLGLKNLLTYLNTPHPWPIALTIWLTLFITCCILWVWGQRKDRAARNPLHGILDDYYPQYKMQSNK
ncbi:MAG: NACHT domain-containing protein [Spirulina sp. SIO3F2]|nr:NACHT domain-containing protein [Spirulina sp. SIO3F2]